MNRPLMAPTVFGVETGSQFIQIKSLQSFKTTAPFCLVIGS